ncbi:MAG: Rid family detoxifying hydrolase [Gemmatimonadaceae bacterium]
MLPDNLGAVELRVLGALIEKELSTPDHYPLSLNALTNACNQSSNREPVMALDEGAVSAGVDTLRRIGLVRSFQSSGSRVPKLQHLLGEKEDLSRAELAVVSVLALRGSQTLGEIRTRAARLMPGDSPDGLDVAVDALIARTPCPAVVRHARQPGQKEPRYSHTLGGVTTDTMETGAAPAAARSPASPAHRPIHDANLPRPVGPYSPGMGFERLVFVSGQGATDPATGQLAGPDAAAQTEQCLANLRTILLAAGSDLQYVLRCGVFLLDMKEFQAMNTVYSRVFGEHRPARTTIQAAGLPGEGLRVEIDCIAYKP